MRRVSILLLCLTLTLFLVNVYLSLINPPSQASVKLGLNQSIVSRTLLNLSFSIPLFVSVFLGLLSSIFLFKKIEFRFFAVGILTTTLVLLLAVMTSSIRSHFFAADVYGMYKVLTITINYIYSFGYLLGFYFLFAGTRNLTGYRGTSRWNIAVSLLVVFLIGSLYSVMLFTNPHRELSTGWIRPTHFIPDLLIFLTIIIPSLVAWFLAITTAFNLADFVSLPTTSLRAAGLKNLLYGVLLQLSGTIMIQVLLSIGTARYVEAGLVFTISLIYIFVVVLAAGNFLILKGARKLLTA